jgi:tetratricopeptide (TPR) repeat protein
VHILIFPGPKLNGNFAADGCVAASPAHSPRRAHGSTLIDDCMRFARLRRWLWLPLVLLTVLVGWRAVVWRRAPSPLNPLGFVNVDPAVRFVGDAACVPCHRAIAASYARTGMARSWSTPAAAQVIEDFSGPAEVADATTGYRYQVVRDGDRWMQRETRVDADGKIVHRHEREVAYVLGSGTKGRSYVTDSNGYLTLMPVAWYSRAKKWDMSPGYRGTQVRFSREMASRCIVCHNSYPDYVWGSNNRFRQPLPNGIGCERCHGAGELHVRDRTAAATTGATAPGPDRTIVNPARLPPDLQQDICLQCHVTTSLGQVFVAGGPFDYRPGEPLGRRRLSFEYGGTQAEAFTAVSHGTRLAQSRCFTESGRRLTCTICHDPHVPAADTPRSYYLSRCATCHATGACSRRPASVAPDRAAADRADDCVACHMPGVEPADIEHTVTTDHWIRRNAVLSATPHRPGPPGHDAPLVDFFHETGPGDQGIAHVVAGVGQKDQRHLARGTTLLGRALASDPGNLRWQTWLALGECRRDSSEPAAARLDTLLASVSDWRATPLDDQEVTTAYIELAQTYLRAGKIDSALAALDRLMQVAPDCMTAYELAARIHVGSRRHADAIRVARAGLERNPAIASLWWTLGWKQYDFAHRPREALTSLLRALELDPMHLETRVVLSHVYEALARTDDAEASLHQVLELNAGFVPGLLALADFLIRHDRPDEAVPLIQSVLERAPGNIPAQQLFRAAQKSLGTPK